jgi:hypothetical protein
MSAGCVVRPCCRYMRCTHGAPSTRAPFISADQPCIVPTRVLHVRWFPR